MTTIDRPTRRQITAMVTWDDFWDRWTVTIFDGGRHPVDTYDLVGRPAPGTTPNGRLIETTLSEYGWEITGRDPDLNLYTVVRGPDPAPKDSTNPDKESHHE